MPELGFDPGYDAFRSVSRDRADSHNAPVFFDDQAGDISSANFTYILSGPPLKYMAEQRPDLLTPIGLLNSVNETGQRPSVSLSEIGSGVRQTAAGAPAYSATLQRVTSYSGNLLGMLYRWAVVLAETQYSYAPNAKQSGGDPDTGKSLQFMTLNSEIMDVPFGVYIITTTESGAFINAVYWENCLVLGKGRGIPAGEAVILENVQLVYEREWPMSQLITLADGSVYGGAADTTETFSATSAASLDGAILSGGGPELPPAGPTVFPPGFFA